MGIIFPCCLVTASKIVRFSVVGVWGLVGLSFFFGGGVGGFTFGGFEGARG